VLRVVAQQPGTSSWRRLNLLNQDQLLGNTHSPINPQQLRLFDTPAATGCDANAPHCTNAKQ